MPTIKQNHMEIPTQQAKLSLTSHQTTLVISEQITTLNESFCMLLLVEDEKILNH
jgi:hypothetical protein